VQAFGEQIVYDMLADITHLSVLVKIIGDQWRKYLGIAFLFLSF